MKPDELTKYLDRLVEEAEDSTPFVSFSHVLLEAEFEAVLAEIRGIVTDTAFTVYCRFTDASSVATDQRFYLARAAGGETLLWPFSIDTRLMEQLSRRLDCRLHWISVDEDLHTRGYLCYERGALLKQVLDPPHLWAARLLKAADLRGEGRRVFPSDREFLDAVSGLYVPRDQVWTFGRWDDDEWRAETLTEAAGTVTRSVMLRITPAECYCGFIGEWSDFERASVARRAECRQAT